MINLRTLDRKPKTVITVTVKHPAPDTFKWKPAEGEIVYYFCEDRQRFRTGIFMHTWLEYSNGKEASPFLHENMPYCQTPDKEVSRAYILDLEGFSTYADCELIGEYDQFGRDWSHKQNLAIREREAIERLEAFGEVEAVA